VSLASRLDAALCRIGATSMPRIDTHAGALRVVDTGGDKPALLLAPDGPCVVEHYATLIEALRPRWRVVCADLPGFGFSLPRGDYRHELRQGAEALLAILDALAIGRATLALSCVNGFYALAAARLAPSRIERLILAQTPGMDAMRDWTARIVPAPVPVPVLGQLINRVTRRKIARGWLHVAVADRAARAQFQATADHALCSGGCYCFASVVQGMSPTQADEPLLANIRTPTTLVWGRLDRSHKSTDPETIRRHAPQAKIVTLDAGHFPDLEASAQYVQAVND
jgi:pimeloyl-ACP methyl ester carboxylesterase